MSGYLSSSGIPAARKRFADLAARLREAASGAVVERAAQAIGAQVQAVAKRLTSAHQDSGAAASGLTVTASGGLVQLTSNRYLGYHPWWVFRSGMPPFVIARALKIFKAELEAAIAGEDSPLTLWDAMMEEAAAVKSRAQFKRDTARIFHKSAEGIAKRVAARKLFAASPEGQAKAAARKAAAAAKKKAAA